MIVHPVRNLSNQLVIIMHNTGYLSTYYIQLLGLSEYLC
jgi:hypothetical protein